MHSAILLFILPHLFACAIAATSPTILLNSSQPTSWQNDNTLDMKVNSTDGSKVRAILSITRSLSFVSGFYCSTGPNCNSYSFGIAVVGGKGNPALVWSANPNDPVTENANLTLTRDEGLVLRNPGGLPVWSTRTAGIAVAGMNLTELGNLVLFNETGAVVWQSFDHPTDTLLAGQRLYEDQRLVSGSYYATITATGLSAFTRVVNSGSQMYYHMKPEADTIISSQKGRCRVLIIAVNNSDYAKLQTGGFLENMGTSQAPVGLNRSKLPLDSVVEYVRLHSDGSLKLYKHEPATGPNEMIDMVTKDLGVCQHPRVCGDFGYCSNGNCGCPAGVKGFEWKNGECSRTRQLCRSRADKGEMIEMGNASYFNVIDPTAAVSNIRDDQSCRTACLNNCSCGAVFYRYDKFNDSNSFCYMPSEVLSIRQGQIPNYNFTSKAYIKVMTPPFPRGRLIAIIAGSSSAVLVIFCALIVIFWKKYSKISTDDSEYRQQVPGMPVMFTHEQLRVATGDFKERLGSGGFGSVFKGVLPDGLEIAVKRLHKMGHAVQEFLAEVETIGSIHHFNLVRLVGYSTEKSCLLVYEYMCNGSLENWIFHRDQKVILDWETRKRIIIQIAKGLAYLHEECRQRIIHLDIKPQNILLDANFNVKISDFGLSKLVDRDDSQVLITLRGTPGYIAPECGHSKITVKVDVYSFGIVLLEIVTGRRNLDASRSESSKHLLKLMKNKAMENHLLDIVDDLNEEMPENQEEMLRMIRIAAWCLQNEPTERPLMSTVVKLLEGVMEVDPNISYEFTHAMGIVSASVASSSATLLEASVLSNPR